MNLYENINCQKLNDIRKHVDENSDTLTKIICEIITPFCTELDKLVAYFKSILEDKEQPITQDELDDICLYLSTYIYSAGSMCEYLGVKDDISKAVYKEMYNVTRDNSVGTINDKNSLAELASQQEYLVSICYNRAYKIMKAKVENAQEILASCKKVISRRMQEMELTKIGGNLS